MPACVLADGGHFAHMMWTGWSHLIWHNFVKVADNWIKIRSLAYMGTRNRRVKFGWKIFNRFGKIATSPQGGFFDSHCRLPIGNLGNLPLCIGPTISSAVCHHVTALKWPFMSRCAVKKLLTQHSLTVERAEYFCPKTIVRHHVYVLVFSY